MLLVLLPSAHAHPSPGPHLHPDDPVAAWVVGGWIVAGVVWWLLGRRTDPPKRVRVPVRVRADE